MKEYNTKLTYLVFAIAAMAAVVSAFGLFYNQEINVGEQMETLNGQMVNLYGKGIYHNDSISMAVQAKGQDLVTLFMVVPLLLYSLKINKKNALQRRFLLTGTLAYFLYGLQAYTLLYLVYALGAAKGEIYPLTWGDVHFNQ